MMLPPNYRQIVKDLTITGGKRKGRMRKSSPHSPKERQEDTHKRRTYYVWRLARFHGGADVTMPMIAETECDGDPFLDELDKLAGRIAEVEFGTQMAAAARWGQALGHLDQAPDGLPDSAQRGGPVADEHKPLEERVELDMGREER